MWGKLVRAAARIRTPRGRTRWAVTCVVTLAGVFSAGRLLAEGATDASKDVERGAALFSHKWSTDDALTPLGDGLGPMFNGHSCAQCHHQGGIGGSGDADSNVDLLTLIPPSNKDQLDRQKFMLGVAQIHPGLVTNSRVAPSITLHQFGTDPAYGKWRIALLMLVDALNTRTVPERIGFQITQRNTPTLAGAGLIDSIPDSALQQLAAQQARSGKGIQGKVALASNGRVGKFGWRGQTATLTDFVLGACANELGLQVVSSNQAPDPLVAASMSRGVDLDMQQCNDLIAFVASLPAPEERFATSFQKRESRDNGERLFAKVGCSSCHVPELGGVAGIYSDLLLHDMGAELADPVSANFRSGSASSGSTPYYGGPQDIFVDVPPESLRQWRTPPLWGVALSAPYLHDGRAKTLHDAILKHDGEAATSRLKYEAMAQRERNNLLSFLESAGAPSK